MPLQSSNSSFVVKSHTVVNHVTDVVDCNDDMRCVIRHHLADEEDEWWEGSFLNASRKKLHQLSVYFVQVMCLKLLAVRVMRTTFGL